MDNKKYNFVSLRAAFFIVPMSFGIRRSNPQFCREIAHLHLQQVQVSSPFGLLAKTHYPYL